MTTSDSMAGSNRRSTVRVKVGLSVRIARGKTSSYTVAADLSQGGMFIHELLPYETGTTLDVSFLLPGSSVPIECRAKVAQARSEMREGFPNSAIGNGLRFVDLNTQDRLRITKYLREQIG